MKDKLEKTKEQLEHSINDICHSLFDLTGEYYIMPIEKDNELWASASKLSFKDNEHLRRTIVYKKDFLKICQKELAKVQS